MTMPKKKKKCNHFWEIVFPITDIEKQAWRCMKCGEKKKDSIPIFNPSEEL